MTFDQYELFESDRTPLPPPAGPEVVPPRVFLREPGWRVAVKVGSSREFCYNIAPGQDSYHRLADGEIYIHRGDERLCLPCAGRRGLLAQEPRALREPVVAIEEFDVEASSEYDVREI